VLNDFKLLFHDSYLPCITSFSDLVHCNVGDCLSNIQVVNLKQSRLNKKKKLVWKYKMIDVYCTSSVLRMSWR